MAKGSSSLPPWIGDVRRCMSVDMSVSATGEAEASAAPVRPSNPFRVVLTGGPGGGKTTAADLFRREIGERVIVVPEAATLLFSGGFPRLAQSSAQRSTQCAIYHVQRGREDIQAARYPDRILLCDPGTEQANSRRPGNLCAGACSMRTARLSFSRPPALRPGDNESSP